MNGRRTLGLALAAVITAFAFGMEAGRVEAAPDSLLVIALSENAGHVVQAYDVPTPGLVAWSVELSYDSSLVTLDRCIPQSGSQCDPEFADDTVRVSGANDQGLSGRFDLAGLVFTCLREGEAAIGANVEVWAHAGTNGAVDADVQFQESRIVCGFQQLHSQTPTPTTPPSLPPTGAGPTDGWGFPQWAIALLTATGASLVALAALRRDRA